MLAEGFKIAFLAGLVRNGLVTAELTAARVVWVQITELGREAHPLTLRRPRVGVDAWEYSGGLWRGGNEAAGSNSYWITSLASVNKVSGIFKPRALAVRRLITNSIFVDCWTGRSAGFSPFRMRPTYLPPSR